MPFRKKSSSCPPTFSSFRLLSDPLSIEQLKNISDNDKSEMEKVTDYECDGYMPIKLCQEIGPDSRFKVIRKLGFGTYSSVWMCKDQFRNTERYYAVKISKSSPFGKSSAKREIELLDRIHAQDRNAIGYNRFISFYGYFNKISGNGKHCCLVSGMMGKSLKDLVANNQRLNPQGVKLIIKQIAEGLNYLHTRCKIIHTDIKLENMLIYTNNAYLSNMASYVRQFNEHGVIMPRSYMSAIEWEEQGKSYQKGVSKEISKSISENAIFYENHDLYKLPKSNQYAAFVDPNIQIKICDLGSGLDENGFRPTVVQPWVNRALEVFIEAPYSFPIDMWALGCLSYRLATGNYLFISDHPSKLPLEEGQLCLIWNLLNGIPKDIALSGKKSSHFFDSEGRLQLTPMEPLESWKISHKLVEQYGWKIQQALIFEEFVMSLIEPDPALRSTASTVFHKRWLQE